MRFIKTKPSNEAQIENFNRYGAAIIITAFLCVVVLVLQTVADFYSLYLPFQQKFTEASPEYGKFWALLVALAVPGLLAYATHFLYGLGLSMFFNGKHSADKVLFFVVCLAGGLFACGQFYVSREGGKNAATTNFGYKANLRNESEADNMYNMEMSTANTLFRSDSTLIAQSSGSAIATAQTRVNSAKEADKNWLRKDVTDLQNEKAKKMQKAIDTRTQAINEATKRRNEALTDIKSHNGKETVKADTSEAKYSSAGQWVAIVLIPLFAFLKWLNAKFSHICGIQVEIVSDEKDFEMGVVSKLWYALSDSLAGQFHNFAVKVHNRLKPDSLSSFSSKPSLPSPTQNLGFAQNVAEISASAAEISKPKSKMQRDIEFASQFEDKGRVKATVPQTDAPTVPTLNYFTMKGIRDKGAMMRHRRKEGTVTQDTYTQNMQLVREAEKAVTGQMDLF